MYGTIRIAPLRGIRTIRQGGPGRIVIRVGVLARKSNETGLGSWTLILRGAGAAALTSFGRGNRTVVLMQKESDAPLHRGGHDNSHPFACLQRTDSTTRFPSLVPCERTS